MHYTVVTFVHTPVKIALMTLILSFQGDFTKILSRVKKSSCFGFLSLFFPYF